MDIIFGMTASYLKYALVTMASVYVNQPDGTEINFWILNSDFTESDKKTAEDFAAAYGQKAYCVYVDEAKYSVLLDKFNNSRWTTSATYRLFAAELLPSTVKRALYLDVDIAVNGDLTEMYDLDFGDDLLIASKEEVYDPRNEPENEFETFDRADPPTDREIAMGAVFNSGVLLMNLEKFREYKIDANYYADKVGDRKLVYPDQGALALCFFDKTKLLTTCKYNYRIQYSMIDFVYRDDLKPFDRDNFRWYDTVRYEFVPVDAKIIHYCGYYPIRTDPWFFCFEPGEIKSYENNFLGLVPEYADYVKIWWKYAKLTPYYDELWETQQRNKSTYILMRKILLEYGLEFQNMAGFNSLKVPTLRNMNSIRKNDDLDRYTKPGVYRCIDKETKSTVKKLPEDFTEECGFRLTVKHISAYAAHPEMTPCIQILEPNTPDAPIYRRHCARPKKGLWSKWYRMATTDDIISADDIGRLEKQIGSIEQTLKSTSIEIVKSKLENSVQLEENVQKLLEQLETEREKNARSMKSYYELKDRLFIEKTQHAQTDRELVKTKKLLEEEKNRNGKLLRFEKEVGAIRASVSYKIGRFFTFIPRKLRSLFNTDPQ